MRTWEPALRTLEHAERSAAPLADVVLLGHVVALEVDHVGAGGVHAERVPGLFDTDAVALAAGVHREVADEKGLKAPLQLNG